MIRTVGVTQMKYCYRMNINSVHTIYSICFPFELAKLWRNALPDPEFSSFTLRQARFLTLFSVTKRNFDIHHHVNPQNDHVWSCDGEVGP